MNDRRISVHVALAGLLLVANTLGGSGLLLHADAHTATPDGEPPLDNAERLLQQL